jgi:predicted phosphoribosyltransferase
MLCEKLFHFRGLNPLVLGLSPGAVPMACLIARYLKGEADVLLVEKMTSPENPNFAMGALVEGGTFTLAPGCSQMWVPPHFWEEENRKLSHSLQERRKLYTPHRGPLSPANRIVILVDDTAKTGLSLLAAYQSVDGAHPAQVLVSAPAVSAASLDLLRRETEEVLFLWNQENWVTPAEIYEINPKLGEEEAALFLQPQEPKACISRGRSTPFAV